MIRAALLGLAATGLAAPALAAEGGVIRGGEHDGFTRLVLTVEPTTEWSLETVQGRATLRFPGKQLAFGTEGVYDKIPRSRVKAVSVAPVPSGTVVTVDLGCDCRVSTSFVGAQYLALDIADRDAAPAPVEPPPETAEARSVRETAAVANAEQALIRQIERAASQGIVRFSNPNSPPTPEIEVPPQVETAAEGQDPAGEAAAPTPLAASSPHTDAAADPKGVLAALDGNDQVLATSVYDRDTHNALAGRTPAEPEVCLDDALLDVGAWSNGLPLMAQSPELSRQLVSEFDTPNPEALHDLARLYIRFGFGAEAEALLAAFAEAPIADRVLLIDLARAVEGRPVSPDGPLALAEACPGNHGLWLALGGTAPVYHDAESFGRAQAAFSALPVDLRLLLAPGFIERLLEAGHAEEARLIHETAVRPGETAEAAADLDLAAARIAAAEGHPDEAVRALSALIEADGHASVEVLTALMRIVLDGGLAVPERILTDLRAAALQYRGAAVETELRTLLVEALARRPEMTAALRETRAAMRDLPAAGPDLAGLFLRLLAEADPAVVGKAIYAEAALGAQDLLAAAPATDPTRIAIGARLVELGLPDPALAMVAPAVAAGSEAARLVAARAELGRGNGEAARTALGPLGGAEASELRARSFALSGDYGQALSTLADGGMATEAEPYAWPSGDWSRARDAAAGDPSRLAMASYMTVGAGGADAPAPAPDPDALSPDLAFQEPLPQLDRPTLDAARRLLSTGGKIEGFVEDALAADPPASE